VHALPHAFGGSGLLGCVSVCCSFWNRPNKASCGANSLKTNCHTCSQLEAALATPTPRDTIERTLQPVYAGNTEQQVLMYLHSNVCANQCRRALLQASVHALNMQAHRHDTARKGMHTSQGNSVSVTRQATGAAPPDPKTRPTARCLRLSRSYSYGTLSGSCHHTNSGLWPGHKVEPAGLTGGTDPPVAGAVAGLHASIRMCGGNNRPEGLLPHTTASSSHMRALVRCSPGCVVYSPHDCIVRVWMHMCACGLGGALCCQNPLNRCQPSHCLNTHTHQRSWLEAK
jgi:hypothetical protein